MSNPANSLPNDPAELKAMIAALQAEKAQIAAENAKMSATLRAHDQLVQALRLRIAKLQKLAFGKSSEKVEREIEQLELALEDLLVAVAEKDESPIDEGLDEPASEEASAPVLRRRPRVSDATPRERRELDPGACCPDCGGDLRVVGEDVSELLDMIAAQMKVIYYPAGYHAVMSRKGRSLGSRNPVGAASGWCKNLHPAVRSRAAWPGRTSWRMCWSRSSTTICLFTASMKSSSGWGPTFPKAHS
tara:strand:- start:5072 stop:5809 length:738 start_codon:yes stop_codon:yes gene_type:complete